MSSPAVSRRGFVELFGAGWMAVLAGDVRGSRAQVVQPNDFDAYGLLVGPESQRPNPNGSYLGQWDTYRFVYIASDTGGRFTIKTGDSEWNDISPVVGSDILTESQTVVNDATEVFVYEAEIEAGELRVDEQHRTRLHGIYSSTNSSDTFKLRAYINGNLTGSTDSEAKDVNDAPFRSTFVFTVRETGGSGKLQPYIESTFDNVNKDSSQSLQTIDTTVTLNIRISVEWTAADVGNEVILEQASHELIS